MHDVDQTTEQMVRSVLAYAENRLRMNPVPLDKAMLPADELYERLDGLIREAPRQPDEVLGVYTSVIAPSVISADSPRFLGFIPAAPTKASLLFDMLVSCASIPGHLLARSVRRDCRREQRARGDRPRSRASRDGGRVLRVRWLGGQPVGSPWRVRRPRRGAPRGGCGWWSDRMPIRRS